MLLLLNILPHHFIIGFSFFYYHPLFYFKFKIKFKGKKKILFKGDFKNYL